MQSLRIYAIYCEIVLNPHYYLVNLLDFHGLSLRLCVTIRYPFHFLVFSECTSRVRE